MALKDVCRKPSIRLLTKPAGNAHVSHKPTLLTIDWSNVSAEEYQMMAMCWVTTHYQQWIARVASGPFAMPIPEKDEVSVRWLLDEEMEKETRSEEIPDAWKGKVASPTEVLESSVSKMSHTEIQALLQQLQALQLNNTQQG